MNHDDRLIVALDFPTMEQAKAVVLELGDNVSHYKVGMEHNKAPYQPYNG